ncbi:MAG: hypothetical protein JXB60_01895 [Candidatus Cloacimonetes bacterium]|nr:hypothetical protein [Candidatus Cloacimonadota bacterium]
MRIQIILPIVAILFLCSSAHADPPEWEVITGTEFSMVMMTQVSLNGEPFTNYGNNILAAFGPGGDEDCRSLAVWQEENPPYYDAFWYMTIVGNEEDQGQEIFFKIYDDTSEGIFNCLETVIFQDNQIIGSPTQPFQLTVTVAIGYISGQITIMNGGNVEEVEVNAGFINATPDAEGNYLITAPPGIYEVTACLAGYLSDPFSYPDIIVLEDETVENTDFTLSPLPDLGLALPDLVTGSPGMDLSLPISLYNNYLIGIEGIDIMLDFDSDILTALSATLENGVLYENDYNLFVNLENPGEIAISIIAAGQLFTGSGEIAFLDLMINPETSVGEETDIIFSEAQINEQPAETFDCHLTVSTSLLQISGSINYYSNNTPIPSANLVLSGEHEYSEITGETGEYLITGIIPGNYVSSPLKNNDLGGLSGTDASRVARYSTGLYSFNCQQIIAADVTLNGSVSGTDASRIARYAAQLINDMNSGINWVFLPEPVLNCDDWPPIIYDTLRVYNPLVSDMTEQTFIGLRLGDVSGNWTPATRNRPVTREDPTASLPELEAQAGSMVTVPLSVSNLIDLEGMDITIQFNPLILEPIGASLENGILSGWNYSLQVNTTISGHLIIVIYATQQLFSGDGEICHLQFEVTGSVGDYSDLSFTQFDVNETSYLQNTVNGGISIVGSSNGLSKIPAVFRLEQNTPNPFNPVTEIRFSLPENSDTRLRIFNLKGELLEILLDERKPAGYYSISWDASRFCSGIYLVELSANQNRFCKKALLLK